MRDNEREGADHGSLPRTSRHDAAPITADGNGPSRPAQWFR